MPLIATPPSPAVTFVVPCYNLASLLPECVHSILHQTYEDFEVLIMDDCSPDNTPEVAQSFNDRRVVHVRNDPNLGHIRNYNKGIAMARGRYVWLISADDFLRKPYVLQRYVAFMDQHPTAGYVFCPGYGVRDRKETRLLGRLSALADRDRLIPGHSLLKKLLFSNFILTPSGLVRRTCYERLGSFNPDLPWCGDWYLWCLFALYYDVGYFADPMMCYREQHDLSMTHKLTTQKLDTCAREELAIPWIIRNKALGSGFAQIATVCLKAAAYTYANIMASERFRDSSFRLNLKFFEESLQEQSLTEKEKVMLRSRVYAGIGSYLFWSGDRLEARHYYKRAIAADRFYLSCYCQLALLALGRPGHGLRELIRSSR
jgi:glycosyltransferase involved in cell wall biosynthesis